MHFHKASFKTWSQKCLGWVVAHWNKLWSEGIKPQSYTKSWTKQRNNKINCVPWTWSGLRTPFTLQPIILLLTASYKSLDQFSYGYPIVYASRRSQSQFQSQDSGIIYEHCQLQTLHVYFKCYLASCSNCEKDTANLNKIKLPSNKADGLSDGKEPSVCDGILY